MNDELQATNNLLVDSLSAAFSSGYNLDDVLVLAAEQWLAQDVENEIDPSLARILARISAEHVRTDLDAREAARQPRRRHRKTREAMLSPLPPLTPNDSQPGEEAKDSG